MATKISFSNPRADTHISSSCGGKRVLYICEHVKFAVLLMYQLQFKAGSDLDEKLSKKTKVIKQVVCDSVLEKFFSLRIQ